LSKISELSLLDGLKRRRVAVALALALFALPMCAVPVARAQESGSAASQSAEKPKGEADETEAFRHSPTVKWVAKTLNVEVETAAKGLELINFAVIVLALGIPLVKVLPNVLKKRTETLSKELEAARVATADAQTRLSAVEAKLTGLDTEIAAIRRQVEEDMVGDEARIKASIEEESARIVAAAEQEISVAASQAQRGLKQYAAELAVGQALKQLSITADDESALIAEFAKSSSQGRGGVN
jgi:F-type H+-transporting ATPase subunit b